MYPFFPLVQEHLKRIPVRVLVELGDRAAQTTRFFLRSAPLVSLFSIDKTVREPIADPRYHFIQEDSLTVAGSWTRLSRRIRVDALFIQAETSRDHVWHQLHAWLPLLATHCLIFFLDLYQGVVEALSYFLATELPRQQPLVQTINNWQVELIPNGRGLVVLSRS